MTIQGMYAEYQESAANWVGAIPKCWSQILLSQAVFQVKNKNLDLQETNLLSLSYGKIKRKSITENGGLLPESFDGYNIIKANDIVLRLTDLQNDQTSLRVGISTEQGIITSAYVSMRPRDTQSAKYIYYLLHAFDIRKGFYGMGSGVRQGLNYSEIKKMKIPYPPIAEQVEIAKFLDTKILHIDSIIAEAKVSIEDYKKWKSSIIYEAVTKGIDSEVEMKDTGVPWIGEIPHAWNLFKLNYALNNISDVDHYMPDSTQDGVPYIMTSNLEKEFSSIRLDACKKISREDYLKLSKKSKIQHDDVIFARYATIGTVSYVDIDIDCIVSYSCVVISPDQDKLSGRYLFYYLQSEAFKSEVRQYINTNIQGNVGKDSLYKSRIILPPLSSQIKICRWLDEQCGGVDNMISEKEALIADLEAYKKSLIFEVVTGKRKVV